MASEKDAMVDPAIFEHLQARIDEDSEVREQLRIILQDLEKQGQSRYSFKLCDERDYLLNEDVY